MRKTSMGRKQSAASSGVNQKTMNLDDLYLMCVDPSSKKTFKINIGTQESEEVKLKPGREITSKINRELYKIDQLIDRRGQEDNWNFQNEVVNNYRRMMVPFYLMAVESPQYPMYVDNSNIDQSLIEDKSDSSATSGITIENIKINMSESISSLPFNLNKVSLLTTADDLIKMCERKIRKQSMLTDQTKVSNVKWEKLKDEAMKTDFMTSQTFIDYTKEEQEVVNWLIEAQEMQGDDDELTILQDNPLKFDDQANRMSMLKFKNFDSYLYGDTQLVYFVETRKFLRERRSSKDKPLDLVFLNLTTNQMPQEKKHDPNESMATTQKREKTNQTQQRQYEFPPLLCDSVNFNHFEGSFDASIRKATQKFGLGQGRRRTSQHQGKSLEDQIVSRYNHVSIFGWYPPQKLSDTPKVNAVQQVKNDSIKTVQTVNESVPYVSDDWGYSNQMKNQGNNSFLKYPSQGYFSYETENEILQSCDIYEPLKVNLLSVNNLSQTLQRFVGAKKDAKPTPQNIPLMTYLVPNSEVCDEVAQLLADCDLAKGDKYSLRRNLIDPFSNYGKNAHFTQGFSDVQFQLEKQAGQKIRSKEPFTFLPRHIQIQAALYLGCRRISCFSYSKPSLFGNTTELDDEFLTFYRPVFKNQLRKQKEQQHDVLEPEVKGERISIACLPSFTRLCINVIVIPEENSCKIIAPDKQVQVKVKNLHGRSRHYQFLEKEGFVFGSIQMSLFDENFLLRQGQKEVRLWPFEQYDPRMVCQGECYVAKDELNATIKSKNSKQIMKLQLEFQDFPGKVGWNIQEKEYPLYGKPSLIDSKFRKAGQDNNKNQENGEEESQRVLFKKDLDTKVESLQQVKKLLDAYPMEVDEDVAKEIDVAKVLEHSNYIYKLPVFIKLIDFTDQKQVKICYDVLKSSSLGRDMTPAEAIALLDGEFGDIKVRIFAVQKLSMLSDLQIALFMPQLTQALKYELFHHSPLAEFLLEKALSNTRVVGHAFFWALKACLIRPQVQDIFSAATTKKEMKKEKKEKDKEEIRIRKRLGPYLHSQERFFLIQERFLLCCGQFKNDIFKQNLVNISCIKLSNKVITMLEDKNVSKTIAKLQMHVELKKEEIRIKLLQQLIIAHGRFDDMKFSRDGTIFKKNGSGDISLMSNSFLNSLVRKKTKTKFDNQDSDDKFIRTDAHNQSKSTLRSAKKSYEFNQQKIMDFIEQHIENIYDAIKEKVKYPDITFEGMKVDWQIELMYIPFTPKEPLSAFASKGGSIFMSKKKPLLIVCQLANEKETELAVKAQYAYKQAPTCQLTALEAIEEEKLLEDPDLARSRTAIQQNRATMRNDEPPLKFMFKSGDDLRQDNLVLQFFKVMDKIWGSAGLDMSMICYDVMESGFETGYIEFVDNATCITDIHKQNSSRLMGPLEEKSMINYFIHHLADKKPGFCYATSEAALKKKLEIYHLQYMLSLAGQCVATYVLGIRDRHPGNFMLQNESGKFFHIDFGHFLGHGKSKLGFKRDREPFILSNEMQYFLKYFGEIKISNMLSDSTRVGDKTWSSLKKSAMKDNYKQSQAYKELADTEKNRVNALINAQSKQESFDDKLIPVVYKIEQEDGFEKETLQGFQLYFEDPSKKKNQDKEVMPKSYKPPDFYEDAFQRNCQKAFLEIRRNADIFVNLLTLMLVCDLEELDQPSIDWMKEALFLDVSEEEATVMFKQKMAHAKRQWYRPYDNIMHIISDDRKDAKLAKREGRAEKAQKKKEAQDKKKK